MRLPTWVISTSVGRPAASGRARPRSVSSRTKCFIDKVSPARSSVRSNTVCARRSAAVPRAVGTSKRQGSMPRIQRLKTKETSPPARAVTNRPSSVRQAAPLSLASSPNPRSMRAMPAASVLPLHSGWPRQSLIATFAPATGRPRASVVTHTRLDERPRLKCTAMPVTSAPVRAYMGARLASSDWPRMRDSISTTW